MRALIVIAHPLQDGLCRSLARTARESLESGGHEVTIEDLYAASFAPTLTADEWRGFHNGAAAADAAATARLTSAEIIVLVFPTWWFGFPAILKGWFDRVWAPGVVYDNARDGTALKPRLTGLKHAVAITSLGAPRWVDWLVLRQPVKRILKRGLFGVCAPQATFSYLALYGAEQVSPERHRAFTARIKAALSRLG